MARVVIDNEWIHWIADSTVAGAVAIALVAPLWLDLHCLPSWRKSVNTGILWISGRGLSWTESRDRLRQKSKVH